jgi:hypothetical protein
VSGPAQEAAEIRAAQQEQAAAIPVMPLSEVPQWDLERCERIAETLTGTEAVDLAYCVPPALRAMLDSWHADIVAECERRHAQQEAR